MSDIQLTSLEAKACYGIGRNVGQQLAGQKFEGFDVDALCRGIKDALTGADSLVSQEELQVALGEISQRMQAAQAEKAKVAAAEGEAFLAENAKRDEVIVTESGLQYEILVEGNGAIPGATDKVLSHYHGTLIDGTVFDSSVERNSPLDLPVNGVIQGWQEALQLMPVGSKWKLYIPYQLAYGENGAGGAIPPYAALVFELELLDIL